jgi:hypothetical protein
MDPLDRRRVLKLATVSGLVLGALPPATSSAQESPGRRAPSDREHVLAAGMSEAEADCWEQVNRFASAFLRLEPTAERHEHVHAIHRLQEWLLARPTYRRYLESAGAGRRDAGTWAELEPLTQVDLERARAAGLDEAEAACWEELAAAAAAFSALPKLHPMADHELAHAFHALRDMLLARATRRRLEAGGNER